MSLEREIEDLLAVDPAPDFVARVRQRVATESAPRSRWTVWTLVPAGAALAALIVFVMWSEPPSHADVQIVQAGRSDIALPAPPSAVVVVSREPAKRTRRQEREVVVSSSEAEGMRLLLDRVAMGQLPDMRETLARMDATGPEWIEVVPLVIDPIPQGEGE